MIKIKIYIFIIQKNVPWHKDREAAAGGWQTHHKEVYNAAEKIVVVGL